MSLLVLITERCYRSISEHTLQRIVSNTRITYTCGRNCSLSS